MPDPMMPMPTNDPTMGMPSAMPPTGMPEAGPDEFATPEQKQQLMDLIQQIRSQLGQLNALQFANTNKSQQQRNDILKEVFSELQAAGVDLRDPQSVSDFIAKLRAQSPDLADLFEQSMGALLGEDPSSVSPQNPDQMMPPSGAMPMEMNNETQNFSQPPQS